MIHDGRGTTIENGTIPRAILGNRVRILFIESIFRKYLKRRPRLTSARPKESARPRYRIRVSVSDLCLETPQIV